MTYPLSVDVTAGQPTAAAHYNNLRADALRLGQAAADSLNVDSLIASLQRNLTIQILSTDRLRVPATSAAPVALVVDNCILYTIANVDLPTNGKPYGSAAMWYLFAYRTPASTAFTLVVNTSPTESTGYKLIGSFYWNGTAIEAPSIRTTFADTVKSLLNILPATGCQGRLSLDSTAPSIPDQSGTTLYLLPYKGNQISLYTPGWGWNNYAIPGAGAVSVALSALNTAKCYDVFAYWTGSAVAIEYLAWTDLLNRAVSLAWQDGLLVKATDKTRLYLGTFNPASGTSINDTVGLRTLWNYYNRLPRPLSRSEPSASWNYASAAWRQGNNSSSNQFTVVTGIAEDVSTFDLDVMVLAAAGYYAAVGIGIDSAVAVSSEMMVSAGNLAAARLVSRARLRTVLTVGAHNITWLEYAIGAASVTYYGAPTAGPTQSNLTGLVMG